MTYSKCEIRDFISSRQLLMLYKSEVRIIDNTKKVYLIYKFTSNIISSFYFKIFLLKFIIIRVFYAKIVMTLSSRRMDRL